MSAGGIRAGRAFVELGANDRKLQSGLKAAQAKLKSFGKNVAMMGGAMAAAGTAVLSPMIAATAVFAKSGDELSKAADKTGASVESLSELRHAAEQSAVPFSKLTAGINKQQKELAAAAAGSDTARAKFEDLGLSVEKMMGLSPDEQFEAIASSIAGIDDPAKRAAAAMSIFGRSGADMLPLLITDIDKLRQEARDLGLQVSGSDAAAATLFGDTWAVVQKTLKQVVFQVGAALAPVLTQLMQTVTPFIVRLIQWIGQNRQLVVTVAKLAAGVVAAGAALVGLGATLSVAGMAIGGILTAMGAASALFAAILSPIGLVVAGVVGLGAAFLTMTDQGSQMTSWFGTEFGKLLSIVHGTVAGMFNAIKGGNLALAAEIAFAGIKLAIATVMESVLALFGSSIDEMMRLLAAVMKRIGQVAGMILKAAADAGSFLSNALADSGLVSPGVAAGLRIGGGAMQTAATQFQDDWKGWDSDRDGSSFAESFDTEELRKKLEQLNESAAGAAAAVETAGFEVSQFNARVSEIDTSLNTNTSQPKGATFGTFSGALTALNFGLGNLQQQQLDTQKKIERNTRNQSSGALVAT